MGCHPTTFSYLGLGGKAFDLKLSLVAFLRKVSVPFSVIDAFSPIIIQGKNYIRSI